MPANRPSAAVTDPMSPNHAAVERERLRIAHDLHDDLGSYLIAVKMAMGQLAQALPSNDPALQAAAGRADRLVDQAIEAMHRVLHDLRPPELDLGLVAALRRIAEAYQATALPCRFSSNQAEIDAPPELTLAVLRICREALTNVSKHARASRVELRLTQQSADAADDASSLLLLDIIDDGRGYPDGAAAGASILRRVLALGGTLERPAGGAGAIAAAPAREKPANGPAAAGAGCHLRIRIPMHRTPAEADKIAR
jgi:two-component system sensor histidine kinase UhpB